MVTFFRFKLSQIEFLEIKICFCESKTQARSRKCLPESEFWFKIKPILTCYVK